MLPTLHNSLARLLVALLSLLAAHAAYADTTWVASGNINGTWTADDSPYVVFSGHVVVPTDCTLTLQAGTIVLFTGPYEFVVNGKLQGDGSESDSIRFTCDTVATPTGWRGLRFVVANDSSYLRYGIVEHGRATGVNNERYGGGVEIDSCDVTLSHCAIRHNRAVLEGGGVYVHDYAAPVIEHCVIEGNHSNTRGGGIAARVRVQTALRHCIFRNNSAATDGGGLFMDYRANPYMLSCEIHGNTAGNRGGGMYTSTQRWVQQTYVRNCLWYHNTSNIGGAIHGENAEIVVDFSTFTMNTSLSEGPAIQADGCSLVVNNAIFAHLPSGAIGHVNAQLTVGTSCFFDVDDMPITGVAPEGFGESVQVNLFLDSVDVYRNTFADPAFIDTTLHDFRLSQNTRVASIATMPTIEELETDIAGIARPSPAAAPPDMGAHESTYQLPHAFLCGDLSGVIPTGTYIITCESEIPIGQTLNIEAGTTFLFAGDFGVRVRGLLFAMGDAGDSILFTSHPSYAGRWTGLHFNEPTAGSLLTHCIFDKGVTDTTEGGFLTASESALHIDACAFRDIDGLGGVVFVSEDSVVVERSLFEHCSLPTALVERGGELSLDDCVIRLTSGGLLLRNDGSAVVDGTEFWRLIEPAFLVTDVGTLTINESSITHCRANSSGMAVHGGVVTVRNSTFAHDTSGAGSIIQLADGETTFFNCAFDSCGTMLFEGGGVISVLGSGTATIDSCRFTDNSTTNLGGAALRVLSGDAQVMVTRSTFDGNSATGANGSGGAVYFDAGSMDVTRSLFRANESALGGAAILIGEGASIENSVFYQNNAAQGSAVFLDNSLADVSSCIIAESDGSPALAFWGDCASASVDHNCFSGANGPFQFEDDDPGHGPAHLGALDSVNIHIDSVDTYGNLFAEPLLIDPDAGDFHASPLSPCVNASSLLAPLDPDSSIRDIGIYFSPVPHSPSSAFSLQSPPNGTTVFGQSVVLEWQQSRNNDNAPVRYYLVEAANNPEYDRPTVRLITPDTSLTITPSGGTNYWQVTTFSAQGSARRCDMDFTFIRPETLTPFDLIEPITGYPHPVNWPLEFRWQHSIDPSGQNTVTYSMRMVRGTAQLNIPLDTANSFTTVPADWNIQSGDQIRWSIFAHIDSPDTSIESLSRNWLFLTDSTESATDDIPVVSDFALHPIFPNPFNAQATVSYDVPTPAFVTIRVYDIAGREVDVLLATQVPAGRHSIHWDAARFSSGTYFVRFESNDFTFVRKAILLK